MEQTLVLVKPDAVQRALAGTLISRLESRGLRIVAMKMLQVTPAMARQHYGALTRASPSSPAWWISSHLGRW